MGMNTPGPLSKKPDFKKSCYQHQQQSTKIGVLQKHRQLVLQNIKSKNESNQYPIPGELKIHNFGHNRGLLLTPSHLHNPNLNLKRRKWGMSEKKVYQIFFSSTGLQLRSKEKWKDAAQPASQHHLHLSGQSSSSIQQPAIVFVCKPKYWRTCGNYGVLGIASVGRATSPFVSVMKTLRATSALDPGHNKETRIPFDVSHYFVLPTIMK